MQVLPRSRGFCTQTWEMGTSCRNPMQGEQGARPSRVETPGDHVFHVYHVCAVMCIWLSLPQTTGRGEGHKARLGHVLCHNSAFSCPWSPHNTLALQSSWMLCLILAFWLSTALGGHELPHRQKERARHYKSLPTHLIFCSGKIFTNSRHGKKNSIEP